MAKSSKKHSWTKEQTDDLRAWHAKRLEELKYPPEIVKELTRSLDRWLPIA